MANTSFKSKTFRITQQQMDQFAEITGGTGKIHVDPEYAKNTAFKGTLVHGLFLVAMIEKELTEQLPEYESRGNLQVTFVKPVKADQSFTISGETYEEKDGLKVSLVTENGETAVSGFVTLQR